jgi:hypothetical protein
MDLDPDEELLQEAKRRLALGLKDLEPDEGYSPFDVAYWVTGERPSTKAKLGELCLRHRGLALLLEYLERAEMRRIRVTVH